MLNKNFLFLFCLAFALSGCVGGTEKKPTDVIPTPLPQKQGPVESKPSDTSTPITVKLVLSTAPRLNEQAELTFTISTAFDASNIEAEIVLPEGTNLVSGDLKWRGDLHAKETHTITATIVFVTEGNKAIEAKALSKQENGDVWGNGANLYLHTTAEAGSVGFAPEKNPVSPAGAQETPPAVAPPPSP